MQDRKIIVTGGSYGIGSHIVTALAAAGASVASMARSVEPGQAHAAELTERGPGSVRAYCCDITDRGQVRNSFAQAVADMGGLDGLVHVTGAQVDSGARPEEESDAQWTRMMTVNGLGTFITNQEAFAHMKGNGGRIINFGSGAGILGMANGASYAASKAAVLGWCRSAAMAWGNDGVTVNVVCPAVSTAVYQEYRTLMTSEQLQAHDADLATRIPVGGRLGDTDRDLVPAILFLLGDGGRFITGQILNVDGGMIMTR